MPTLRLFLKRDTEHDCSGTRANLSYLDALAKFHKQQGTNLTRWPYVDKKPLDLYRLKKAVEARGGFEKVCKLKKWAEIGRDLGYSGKIMSSLSTSLKNSYQKWLCPYEDYLRIAKPGVHQQLELEYGGPLTPSPAPTPVKRSNVPTPPSLAADSPARNATDALQASIDATGKHSDPDVSMSDSPASSTPKPTTGFTAVNSGGFTAVNSSSTSANGKTPATPKANGTPAASAKNTPEFRSSGLGPSGLKRQLSCDSTDSAKKDSVDQEDGEPGSRRSKRLKKGALLLRQFGHSLGCGWTLLILSGSQIPCPPSLVRTCLSSAQLHPGYLVMRLQVPERYDARFIRSRLRYDADKRTEMRAMRARQ